MRRKFPHHRGKIAIREEAQSTRSWASNELINSPLAFRPLVRLGSELEFCIPSLLMRLSCTIFGVCCCWCRWVSTVWLLVESHMSNSFIYGHDFGALNVTRQRVTVNIMNMNESLFNFTNIISTPTFIKIWFVHVQRLHQNQSALLIFCFIYFSTTRARTSLFSQHDFFALFSLFFFVSSSAIFLIIWTFSHRLTFSTNRRLSPILAQQISTFRSLRFSPSASMRLIEALDNWQV